MTTSDFIFYTDGSANSQNGLGGWGFIRVDSPFGKILKDESEYGFAPVEETTNNRMEMIAILEALKTVPLGSRVTIITDSGYTHQGYTHPSYLDKWIINNRWKTSTKKDVSNIDLWKQFLLIKQMNMFDLNWIHTRGHSKDKGNPHNPYNEVVDKLCDYKAVREPNHGIWISKIDKLVVKHKLEFI